MRLTELHWYLWSPRTVPITWFMQPWIVGFNGELVPRRFNGLLGR